MIWRAAIAGTIALTRCGCEKFAERAFLIALCGRPIQSVLRTRLADEALGVNSDALTTIFLGIVVLRVNIGKAGLDGIKLIVTNATGENFL